MGKRNRCTRNRKEFTCGHLKTEHFLFRQWDRKVSEKLIQFVLNQIEKKKCKRYIILSRTKVRKIENQPSEFFMLIDGNRLVTCFFEDINCFRTKSKNVQYELIS